MSTDAWKSKPEKSHGRIETREIVVASADWLERKEEWARKPKNMLTSITVVICITGEYLDFKITITQLNPIIKQYMAQKAHLHTWCRPPGFKPDGYTIVLHIDFSN